MNTRRRWCPVLALLTLAACGASDHPGSGAGATQPPATRSPPAPATAPAGSSVSVVAAPTSTIPAPTLEEIVALAEQSLLRGGVYHATTTVSRKAGAYSYDASIELWADAVSTMPFVSIPPSPASTRSRPSSSSPTAPAGAMASRSPDGRAQAGARRRRSCWVARVRTRPRPQPSRTGTHDGHASLVLTTTGERFTSDSSETYTRQLFLQPTSGLPVGMSETGTLDDGSIAATTTEARLSNPIRRPEHGAPAHFDPATLGWSLPDPEAALPTDVPVYWLGRQYEPGSGLPPLVFAAVQPPTGGPISYAAHPALRDCDRSLRSAAAHNPSVVPHRVRTRRNPPRPMFRRTPHPGRERHWHHSLRRRQRRRHSPGGDGRHGAVGQRPRLLLARYRHRRQPLRQQPRDDNSAPRATSLVSMKPPIWTPTESQRRR